MKNSFINKFFLYVWVVVFTLFAGCNSQRKKNTTEMNQKFSKGTYGYDVTFFQQNKIPTIELRDSATQASVLVVPAYQGRIMTSTSGGNNGISFGWINYSLIESGVVSDQFNPVGGEERLWLGPEGGPFSIYFKPGDEQVFDNWVVPAVIDTEPFNLVAHTPVSASFIKDFEIINASGSTMKVGIERNVRILDKEAAELALNLPLEDNLSWVAYETVNTLINKGLNPWDAETGVLSIWLLSMFNPSEEGVVIIPFKTGDELTLGKIVNDDYFGKVPSDRLFIKEGNIFFKTDGKHRSKIGLSPLRALPICGSYDPGNKTLTLLWYSAPETPKKYVNSKWGDQEDPFDGDAVNSYNDGPLEDGSIMGPFYEIESSSPAAFLSPGEKITHTQRIFHITGEESQLNVITQKLFGLSSADIRNAF